MRSGRVLLTIVAAVSPGAAGAAEWYTGAPLAQGVAPTAYIAAFPPQTEPVYTSYKPVVSKSADYVGAPTSRESFGAAIDFAVTADSKGSGFVTAIATIAPFSGLDQSGLRMRLGGVIGQYSYTNTVQGTIKGTQSDVSFMIGYEWVTARASVRVSPTFASLSPLQSLALAVSGRKPGRTGRIAIACRPGLCHHGGT